MSSRTYNHLRKRRVENERGMEVLIRGRRALMAVAAAIRQPAFSVTRAGRFLAVVAVS